MFVHYETYSKNIKIPVGMRYRSCPWKYLQPSTSIFKYSPTSRKLILIYFDKCNCTYTWVLQFSSLWISMPTFLQQNWPHYWKRKMRWLFEIPAGHGMDCSSPWYKPSLMGPHKKEGSISFPFLLYTGALLLLVCLSACIVLMSYGYFLNCQ